MKFKNIMMITLLLLTVLTISCVSAVDNITDDGVLQDTPLKEFELSDGDIVSSSQREIIGEPDDGTFTALQSKINKADINSTVTLENNYSYDEGFSTDGIVISKKITIEGNGFTIDGNDAGRIFKIAVDGVVLNKINFVNGHVMDDREGGAIYASGLLTVTNCNFNDNFGGAIYTSNELIIDNSNFTSNRPSYSDGGAICSYDTLKITNSKFFKNTADYGGAITALRNTTIVNCSFENNEVDCNGGAIESYTFIEIYNSIFKNNLAEDMGGAIHSWKKLIVDGCTFINNNATDGGSIYAEESMTVVNSNLSSDVGCDLIYFEGDLGYNIKNNVMGTENDYCIRYDSNNGYPFKLYLVFENMTVKLKDTFNIGKILDEEGHSIRLSEYIISMVPENGGSSPVTKTLYYNESAGGYQLSVNYESPVIFNVSGSIPISVALDSYSNSAKLNVGNLSGGNENGNGNGDNGSGNGEGNENNNNHSQSDAVPGGGSSSTLQSDNRGTSSPSSGSSSGNINAKTAGKISANIKAYRLKTTYNSGQSFKVKVTDLKTKKPVSNARILLKVYTGKKYKKVKITTDSNGVAKYSASKLKIGTHKIVVSSADKNIKAKSKKSSVKLSKAALLISAPKTTNAYKSGKFKATVKNKKTKNPMGGVKLKIKVYTGKKYKTYSVKTNKKGEASISTKSLSKATHKVVVTAKATKNYKAKTAKSSIKIVSSLDNAVGKNKGPIETKFVFESMKFNYYPNSALKSVSINLNLVDANGNILKKPITGQMKIYYYGAIQDYGPQANGISGETMEVFKNIGSWYTFVQVDFAGDSNYKPATFSRYVYGG